MAGVMGITGKLFEVTNKKIEFAAGLVSLSMIDASYLSMYGFSEIAPDSQVIWSDATTEEQDTYMFMCQDDGSYENSIASPGNKLG